MTSTRHILLIVDEQTSFFRALERAFGEKFDELLHAPTVGTALELLEAYPVTHLVAPLDLGDGQSSFELIPKLRHAYPSIACAVVHASLSSLGEEIPPEIDAVQLEPLSPAVLLAVLKREW